MNFEYLHDYYVLVYCLTSIIVLIFGLCLLGHAVPKFPALRYYPLSRRILGIAYILMAVMSFVLFVPFHSHEQLNRPEQSSIFDLSNVLIVASFQACLVMFSIISLLDVNIFKWKCVSCHIVCIAFLSVIQVCFVHYATLELTHVVLSVYVLAYALQIIYYIHLFRKEYKRCKERLDNFFSEDEEHRIRWIKEVFYVSMAFAALAMLFFIGNPTLNVVFSFTWSIFYVCLAMKYINYPSCFLHFPTYSPPFEEESEAVDSSEATQELDFVPRLELWMLEKGYVEPSITLAELSTQVKAHPKDLSQYINSYFNQNFKLWIRSLRIEEAKVLLKSKQDLPVEHIGEMVGILNKSSFFRQFQAVTEVTPGVFRKMEESY